MLWAAVCLAFLVFCELENLHVLEFIHLMKKSTSQLLICVDRFDSPSMVYVCLKQSKTDHLRKGVSIVLGKTNQPPLCPVSAILSYLVVRGKAAGPLFVCENGHFLTRAHFVLVVKKVLELVEVNGSEA